MRPYSFEKAQAPADALKLKKANKHFVAGGTNLVDLLKRHIAEPDGLIDLTTAMSADIKISSKGLSIGAMARNSALTSNKDITERFPLIAKAVLAGASPQIRNMASTAGNLLQRTRCPYFYDTASPCNKRKPGSGCSALKGDNRMGAVIGYNDQCVAVHPSDLCVALAALDATVHASSAGQRTMIIPFNKFHKLPANTPWLDNTLPENAVITHIEVPSNSFARNNAYVKIRDRSSYAFALISVAAALQLNGDTITDARLASGGVAHKPWRWNEAESFLKGKKASIENFSEASSIVLKDLKPLSENGFKSAMLKGAIETALQNCLAV